MRAHWLLLLALASSPAPVSAQTLKKVAAIDLPGPKGERFDYLTVDEEHQYLLSAHLGPGILYVIDMRTNRLVKAIPGVPGITGLEYVPGLQKIYTSNWGENKIGVVDLRSMTVVKRLPTADKPNGSVYAAPFKKVYVSDTDGRAMAIVDVEKDTILKTLRFNSETGMPQYDSAARKVYVNLRRTNEIAEIDPATDTVTARFPVAGCEHNHDASVRLLRRFAPCVAMVQATEARQGSHFCGRRRLRFDYPLVRGVLFERVVNAVLMVIAHVITHQAEQMSFVQRDDMVQDLSPTTANPSFGGSVLPGRLNAAPLRFQTRRL